MIVELFSGPGGWAEGLRALGLADVGLDNDAAACATRHAAGHPTIRADATNYPPEPFRGAEGLIASPPCPDWSQAGSRAGRSGATGWLVDIVPRWVEAIQPAWVACEQVPGALPVWREHARLYRRLGFSVWAGILNAADYGVPQTRQRAFLLASRVRPVVPPEPTHCRAGAWTLLGQLDPWVSMADALGWAGGQWKLVAGKRQMTIKRSHDRPIGQPAPTLAFGHDSASWAFERPATTIMGDPRCWPPGHKVNADDRARLGTDEADARYGDRAGTHAIRISIRDALILQSFRPDYPVQGAKTKQFEQVGNAVPPLLAAHVLSAVTGHRREEAA